MSTEDDFLKGIQSSDRRTQLETMRDKVAQVLNANKCSKCTSIQMRAGDIASLMLRLQKILEELDTIPPKTEEKTDFQKIKESAAKKVSNGNVVYPFGTKEAPRRQGGRRDRFKPGDA